MTGATVEILSRKNHFELDREIKQDIAAGRWIGAWGRTTRPSRRSTAPSIAI